MNHEEYVRYKEWCDKIYDEEKNRLEQSIIERLNTDSRAEGKREKLLAMFADRLNQCADLGVEMFKNTLLSSGDDDEYMMGVIFHNALQRLYVDDFSEDVILPSETENQMKRKELQALRKKQNINVNPDERDLTLNVADEAILATLDKPTSNKMDTIFE